MIADAKRHQQRLRLLVAILLLTQAVLVLWGGWSHSPVYNEAGHLSAGLSHLHFARFDLFRVNPPLVRTVAALPLTMASPATDWTRYSSNPLVRSEHLVGLDFLQANGIRSLWLITLARWACLPFVLLGGYTCFLWAKELHGPVAGLLGLALWCFSPIILGHASLLTSDAHGAAVGLAACYMFWLWLRKPLWSQALATGLVLGLAELCKFTLIVFYPAWALLWLLYRLPDWAKMTRRDRMHQIGMIAAMILVSLFVINAGYLFEGSFKRLDNYRFQTMALTGASALDDVPAGSRNRFSETCLGWLPVPLPENYVQGIDAQRLDFERGMKSYLGGEWRNRGWWYYYLYAWAIKVPLGTWMLVLLAAGLTVADRCYLASWRDELALLLPMAAILILVSSQTGFSIHSRYAIPALPFLFVWTSKVAQAFQFSHRKVAMVVIAGLVWSIGSSVWCYPHSLSYFNELVGGPQGGHAHLLDSNISWGQDLLYLKQWVNAHPNATPFHLVYHGQVDPRLAGIEFVLPDEKAGPSPGWYGIDVNYLHGSDLQAADGNGNWQCFDAGPFCYFLHFQPVATAGYSIYIYHITLDEANRVRKELGMAEVTETTGDKNVRTIERNARL
jgi:hypothetical protein